MTLAERQRRQLEILRRHALAATGCQTPADLAALMADDPGLAVALGRVVGLLGERDDAVAVTRGVLLADELDPILLVAASEFHDALVVDLICFAAEAQAQA